MSAACAWVDLAVRLNPGLARTEGANPWYQGMSAL